MLFLAISQLGFVLALVLTIFLLYLQISSVIRILRVDSEALQDPSNKEHHH